MASSDFLEFSPEGTFFSKFFFAFPGLISLPKHHNCLSSTPTSLFSTKEASCPLRRSLLFYNFATQKVCFLERKKIKFFWFKTAGHCKTVSSTPCFCVRQKKATCMVLQIATWLCSNFAFQTDCFCRVLFAFLDLGLYLSFWKRDL